MNSDSLFIEMSQVLTGLENLPIDLASDYENRLRAEGFASALDRLLVIYKALKENGQIDYESISANIFSVSECKEVAEQLIVLWYSSALMKVNLNGKIELQFGKPEHHFRALLWDVICAHPPALSGGYFGYWHYPPEN